MELLWLPIFISKERNSKGDPLPADKVNEFVGAGHINVGRVKELLAEMRALLYATWYWDSGDFETALEEPGM